MPPNCERMGATDAYWHHAEDDDIEGVKKIMVHGGKSPGLFTVREAFDSRELTHDAIWSQARQFIDDDRERATEANILTTRLMKRDRWIAEDFDKQIELYQVEMEP